MPLALYDSFSSAPSITEKNFQQPVSANKNNWL